MEPPSTHSPAQSKLPAIGFIENLGADERKALGESGNFVVLAAGDVAIRQGTSQDALYFLVSGLLHAKRSEQGREILLGEIKMGEWFGEVNIFDPGEASATVCAVQSSVVWSITRSQFEEFLNAHTRSGNVVLIGIATILGRRLRGVTSKLMGRSEYSAILQELSQEGVGPEWH